MLPNGTPLQIKNALYIPKSGRNLLSFKDLHIRGYHLETVDNEGKEYSYIAQIVSCQKGVLESFACISLGLYCICIKMME